MVDNELDYIITRESFFDYISGEDIYTEGVITAASIRSRYSDIRKNLSKINKLTKKAEYDEAIALCRTTKDMIAKCYKDLENIEQSDLASAKNIMDAIIDDAVTNKLIGIIAYTIGNANSKRNIDKKIDKAGLNKDHPFVNAARNTRARKDGLYARDVATRMHKSYSAGKYIGAGASSIIHKKKNNPESKISISDFDTVRRDAQNYLLKLSIKLKKLLEKLIEAKKEASKQ